MSEKRPEWVMFYSDKEFYLKVKDRINRLRKIIEIISLPRCVSSWCHARDLEFISYDISGVWTLGELEKKYLGG